MRKLFSILLLAVLASCQSGKVDTILHHAVIYTVDSAFTIAEAMAVKDGKIVATGSNDAILKAYTANENIDAKGAAVYPGFIDAHAHFLGYGSSLAALECGVDVFAVAETMGGIGALREKSRALTGLFIDLVESRCAGHGLTLVTPRDGDLRGSQISFAREEGGYAIMQALIARQVVGDFRAPDILRFGFTPLYTRFVDVWDAVDRLEAVLRTGEWREPRFNVRAAVT